MNAVLRITIFTQLIYAWISLTLLLDYREKLKDCQAGWISCPAEVDPLLVALDGRIASIFMSAHSIALMKLVTKGFPRVEIMILFGRIVEFCFIPL